MPPDTYTLSTFLKERFSDKDFSWEEMFSSVKNILFMFETENVIGFVGKTPTVFYPDTPRAILDYIKEIELTVGLHYIVDVLITNCSNNKVFFLDHIIRFKNEKEFVFESEMDMHFSGYRGPQQHVFNIDIDNAKILIQ